MTAEETHRMLHAEIACGGNVGPGHGPRGIVTCDQCLATAIREAVEAEREACAKLCVDKLPPSFWGIGKMLAKRIRARGAAKTEEQP
jgi:hypothetical protein